MIRARTSTRAGEDDARAVGRSGIVRPVARGTPQSGTGVPRIIRAEHGGGVNEEQLRRVGGKSERSAEGIGKAARAIGSSRVDGEVVRVESADAAECAERPGVVARATEVDRLPVHITRADRGESPEVDVELVAGRRIDREHPRRNEGVVTGSGRGARVMQLPIVVTAAFPDE